MRLCLHCLSTRPLVYDKKPFRNPHSGLWYSRWHCIDCGAARIHEHSLDVSRAMTEQYDALRVQGTGL